MYRKSDLLAFRGKGDQKKKNDEVVKTSIRSTIIRVFHSTNSSVVDCSSGTINL